MNIIDRLNNEIWTTLAPSKIHGIGVIAVRDISKGTKLFIGQEETDQYYEVSDKGFLRLLEPIRNMILDRCQFKQITFRHPNCIAKLQSFMNHSNMPNSKDGITLQDIKKGGEITKNFLDTEIKLHSLILERYKNENID